MAALPLSAVAATYDEGELRRIRTSRISNPTMALVCPRHAGQLLEVDWTRKVMLEDGVLFPTYTQVYCPECRLTTGVDLLAGDPEAAA